MTKKTLENAFIFTGKTPKNNIHPNIYLLSDELSKQDRDILLDLIRETSDKSGADHDLSYEIVSTACDVVTSMTDDMERDAMDEYIYDQENASIYTIDRLRYLTINNQDEISDILKEYECDISTACAVWYDRQVQNVAHTLVHHLNQ